MHIIIGATGHVGSALAAALLERGEPVTVVTHDPAKIDALAAKGAAVAVADVRAVAALRAVFRTGRRAFLLNPPADPSTDTDAEEKATAAAIVAALDGSGLEKVVAESTFGAARLDRAGDLGVLYDFEQALARQPIPAAVIRAAYYMSNWDMALGTARDEGVLDTLFPADFALPMVAPRDLGRVAARLMLEPADRAGIHPVEGPARYTPADVAAAFAHALGRPVAPRVTPRDRIAAAFEAQGFSAPAAASYARMTTVTLDATFPPPGDAEHGETTLQAYVDELVAGAKRGGG